MVVRCTVLNFLVYKAMTKTSLLQRAKQGDAEAIASVINYFIKDKKIIATASVKDGCLKIILESTEIPDRQESVTLIHKLMKKLEVKTIKSVRVYGKKIGNNSSVWTFILCVLCASVVY
jgi:citrate lyase synthetase